VGLQLLTVLFLNAGILWIRNRREMALDTSLQGRAFLTRAELALALAILPAWILRSDNVGGLQAAGLSRGLLAMSAW
jgi:hypothetical protein